MNHSEQGNHRRWGHVEASLEYASCRSGIHSHIDWPCYTLTAHEDAHWVLSTAIDWNHCSRYPR